MPATILVVQIDPDRVNQENDRDNNEQASEEFTLLGPNLVLQGTRPPPAGPRIIEGEYRREDH